MIRTYLKIAWRSIRKHKLVSGINMLGLAIGISCSFFVSVWVLDELRYDRFLPNANRVFRLESITTARDGSQRQLPSVGWPVGKTLQSDYPEVEQLTYVKGWNPQLKLKGMYGQETGLMADEHFLSVLGYELAEGNPQTALKDPFSVILSPQAEEKYFGKGRGMGQILMVNDTLPHRVTGIFKNLPTHAHLRFSMVRSLASLHSLYPEDMTYEYASGWFDLNVVNYVLLKSGTNPGAFANKIKDLVSQRGQAMSRETGMSSTLQLRPVTDIYLHSGMPTENGPVGSAQSLYLFSAIGLFMLLIASLNVINLTTAQATQRAKEVGVKKVLGVAKAQLVGQFLTEAALICLLATAGGILLILLGLPTFNAFTGKAISYSALFSPLTAGLLTGFLALLIPLTGFYPAWVLTRYEPITVLRGFFAHSTQGAVLRKALVVGQFTVAVFLISATIVAWQQIQFMRKQPLGFDQHKVILVDLKEVAARSRNELAASLRNELIKSPHITEATACNAVPGQSGWTGQFATGDGNQAGKGVLVEHIPVDAAYLPTLQLRVAAGRNFSADNKADETESFLINEMSVKAFGWSSSQQALGKKLAVSGVNGKVIGVIRNYHQHSLQETIHPVVMNQMPVYRVVAFRYAGQSPAVAVTYLTTVWEKLFPAYSLNYSYLDNAFGQQYLAEQRLLQTFSVAACLAIFICCMGLFGLATFTAKRRTKEIGVRKVLGASLSHLVLLLAKDFLKLVLIALLLASPLAWFMLQRWLQDFAYRIELSVWVFAVTSLLALGIAFLTVSVQSIRAALLNPVKSLRSE
ncbi:FtsX-like permease family protein [Spirosoma pollinicola]|uniref:Cell division protein FtsX n=1 Tax=Spirosoma pollinicola TaxID=2057025 RepID=A0A2K8Z2V8_9BACT|nr:FtsX-like permease family protein [Spirosoma pollinicola]AUD04169.1 hypothetical protein CWM47_21420 [Spirosoma pollinicola]